MCMCCVCSVCVGCVRCVLWVFSNSFILKSDFGHVIWFLFSVSFRNSPTSQMCGALVFCYGRSTPMVVCPTQKW